jgi:hypothetical protein
MLRTWRPVIIWGSLLLIILLPVNARALRHNYVPIGQNVQFSAYVCPMGGIKYIEVTKSHEQEATIFRGSKRFNFIKLLKSSSFFSGPYRGHSQCSPFIGASGYDVISGVSQCTADGVDAAAFACNFGWCQSIIFDVKTQQSRAGAWIEGGGLIALCEVRGNLKLLNTGPT